MEVLELDVCKNCIQGYGRGGAWCLFWIACSTVPSKTFFTIHDQKLFLNSGIFRVSEDFRLTARRLVGKIC